MLALRHLLSHISARDFVLKLHVVLVDSAFVLENVKNGLVEDLSSGLQVLDAVLSDGDIGLDLVVVLLEVHSGLLLFLMEVWVIIPFDLLFKRGLLLLNLLVDFVDLLLDRLHLLSSLLFCLVAVVVVLIFGDGATHILVNILQVIELVIGRLALLSEQILGVALSE